MSQHTPGPWKVEGKNLVRGADGWKVAAVPSYVGVTRQAANARLIAKAPEMYQELLRLQKYLDDLTLSREDSPSLEDEKGILCALLREIEGDHDSA